MPNAGSRWHERLEIDKPEDWAVFRQPGGMEPGAENLDYLTQTAESLHYPPGHPVRQEAGREYYRSCCARRKATGSSATCTRSSATTRTARRCSAKPSRATSMSRSPLTPSEGHLLMVGQDFGRNPCALICQMSHKGQLLVLEEIVAENIGLEIHTQQHLKPKLLTDPRYMGKRTVLVGDPAGAARNQLSELTCFDYLETQGFMAYPAPTNEIDPACGRWRRCSGRTSAGNPYC